MKDRPTTVGKSSVFALPSLKTALGFPAPEPFENHTRNCQQTFSNELFYHLSIIPAISIIAVLVCYQYSKTKQWKLVLPFNDLVNVERNRLKIVLAFGTFGNDIANELVSHRMFSPGQSVTWYIQPFMTVLLAMELGLTYYPIFACIDSKYLSFSHGLGSFYILILLVQKVGFLSLWSCPPSLTAIVHVIIPGMPDVMCASVLLMLMINDFFLSICDTKFKNYQAYQSVVAKEAPFYVNQIFKTHKEKTYSSWFVKHIWASNPVFKYSTLLISVFLVITIFTLQLLLRLVYTYYFLDLETKHRKTLLVALAFTATGVLVYFAQYLRFLVCHRGNMLKMFKEGSKHVFIKKLSRDAAIASYVHFSGFLVAFNVLGVLIFGSLCSIIGISVAQFIIALKDAGIRNTLLRGTFQLFIIPIVYLVIESLLVRRVFTEPNRLSYWIQNIGIYHIVSYFMFFLNLLLGTVSCLFTSFIGFAINLSSLGRLDICRLDPTHYLSMDSGHQVYLSYLKIESMYKNPVMQCFCQILLEQESEIYMHTKQVNLPRVSMQALNRWHLAVMLIQNPSLCSYRNNKNSYIRQLELDDIDDVSV